MLRLTNAIALVVLLAVTPFAQRADPLAGVWVLNVAQSRYSPGTPPKSQTTILESVDGGLKEIVDRVGADGRVVHWELTAKYDGRDYPVKGDPDRDTVAITRVDDYTIDLVNKKNGAVTTTMRIVVAKDGRTRTNAVSGTTATGQKINTLLVFDRK